MTGVQTCALPIYKQPVAAAAGIGIFKGIDMTAATVTRGMFLRILENALNTDLVNVSISKDRPAYKTDKTETYLSNNYNVYLHKGVITGYKYSSLYGEGELESGKVQINRASYKLNEELSVDCVGYSVCAYVDIEDERKIAALWMDADKNKTYEVEKKDYDTFEASAIRYGSSKRININGSLRMMKNNLFGGYYGTADLSELPETDKIIVIDNDGDGRGDLIKVYKYTHYYVKTVSVTDECVVFGNDLGKQDISDNVYSEFVFEDKIVDPYTDLKANDVLTVLEGTADGKEVFCAEICRDIAEGSISMIGTDPGGTFYVLDGERYYLSDNLINYMAKNSSEKNVGDYVHAYLGSDKRIAYLKTEEDFSFGYLMGAGYDDIEDELIITVCRLDGSTEKLRSAEKVKVYDQKNQTGKKIPIEEIYKECVDPDGSLRDMVVGYTVDSSDKLNQIAFEVPKAQLSNSESYPLSLDLDYNPSGNDVPEARAYHGLFARKWTFDSTTPVLIVPAAQEFRKTEKAYSKATGNKWGNGDGSYLKKGEAIKAYNADKFLRPQFYTVKTAVTTVIGQGGGNVHFCVIDKISETYDEEEASTMTMLSYYADSQYKNIKISEDVEIARQGIFCDVDSIDDLRDGDIIQFHTDAVGNIDILTVYFRVTDPPANGFGSYYFDSDTSALAYSSDVTMTSLTVLYAKVLDIDSNKVLLETTDGVEFPVTVGGYSSYGNSYYLIYDRTKESGVPAKLSDIKPGDVVVMRKYYNHVQDVVIIKN